MPAFTPLGPLCAYGLQYVELKKYKTELEKNIEAKQAAERDGRDHGMKVGGLFLLELFAKQVMPIHILAARHAPPLVLLNNPTARGAAWPCLTSDGRVVVAKQTCLCAQVCRPRAPACGPAVMCLLRVPHLKQVLVCSSACVFSAGGLYLPPDDCTAEDGAAAAAGLRRLVRYHGICLSVVTAECVRAVHLHRSSGGLTGWLLQPSRLLHMTNSAIERARVVPWCWHSLCSLLA